MPEAVGRRAVGGFPLTLTLSQREREHNGGGLGCAYLPSPGEEGRVRGGFDTDARAHDDDLKWERRPALV